MKQSLEEALRLAATGKNWPLARAAYYLLGKPSRECGETQRAWRELVYELPPESERSYTVHEFVNAAYVDDGGIYRRREEPIG